MRFVDTNLLLYSVSQTPSEQIKRQIAAAILENEEVCLSVQVLQEFYTQSTRPTRVHRLRADEASALVTAWTRFLVVDMTITIVGRAIRSSQRFHISYWDAAIIEAARSADCAIVYSEDLNHGQNFDDVTVINPFR